MRALHLPYYLTLFTLSAHHFWPFGLQILEQKNLEERMQSFTGAQMQRFMAFSKGVKAYFEAPPPPPLRSVTPTGGRPVFIIPALVPSPALLNVTPDHSFLSFLTQNGFNPFVLDWALFPPKNHFEDYQRGCAQAYRAFCASTAQAPVVVSWGEGGLFALSLGDPPPAGLVFLDGPRGGEQETHAMGDFFAPLLQSFFPSTGGIPPLLTRLFFSCGQSEKVIQKMIAFPEIAKKDLFVAVEDALNEPRFCPAFLAQSFLSGNFSPFCPSSERIASLQQIPQMRIFPQKESLTLLDSLFPSSQVLRPPLGKFGLLASSFAPLSVWEPLVKWLQEKI